MLFINCFCELDYSALLFWLFKPKINNFLHKLIKFLWQIFCGLLKSSINYRCMYESIVENPTVFSEITDKMYSRQKIDSTFSALGKTVGDDYNVSDRAFGRLNKGFMEVVLVIIIYFSIQMLSMKSTAIWTVKIKRCEHFGEHLALDNTYKMIWYHF